MIINILILNYGCEISFDENNETLQDIINDTLIKYNVKFVYSTNKMNMKKISFISDDLHIILNEILLKISKFEILKFIYIF